MIYDVIFEVACISRGHHYLANLILELDVRVAVTQVFVEHPGEVDVGPFRELDVEPDCLILSRPELSFVHSGDYRSILVLLILAFVCFTFCFVGLDKLPGVVFHIVHVMNSKIVCCG